MSRVRQEPVSILDEYERMMNFLNQDDDRTRDLKKKIFGENIVIHTEDKYDELGMLQELGMHYPEWREYSTRHKAMVRARYILGNMVRAVEMFNDEQERANKKLRDGN